MTEELGKIEKPDAAAYQGERKLFFVPLVGVWLEADEGFNQIYRRYWDQVEAHLQGLEQGHPCQRCHPRRSSGKAERGVATSNCPRAFLAC